MSDKVFMGSHGEIRDFPFEAMCDQAQALIKQGLHVYQKFTCAGCGTRLVIETPNVFFEEGTCDKCSAVTNIKERGCNYSAALTFGIRGGIHGAEPSQGHDRDRDTEHCGDTHKQ